MVSPSKKMVSGRWQDSVPDRLVDEADRHFQVQAARLQYAARLHRVTSICKAKSDGPLLPACEGRYERGGCVVIVPTFHREQPMHEAIGSVLRQSDITMQIM